MRNRILVGALIIAFASQIIFAATAPIIWYSSVLSENSYINSSGQIVRDSIIERVSDRGSVIRLTIHSTKIDSGQAFSTAALARIEYYHPNNSNSFKSIDFAISVDGQRGVVVNGQQSVILHVSIPGRKNSDVKLLVDANKLTESSGLSLEQGLRQYADQQSCNCGQSSLYGKFKGWLTSLFFPSVSALDCMNYCFENGYDCYLLGLFTGLEGYLSCIGACVAACLAIELLGG